MHRRAALRLQLRALRVQQQHARGRTGEAPEQGLLRHQGASAAVLQHEGQALARQGWVQRQIRAAGMLDANESDHQLQRALHAHADDGVGADALAPQPARELVGPVLQLGVRQALAVDYCGEGLRGKLCLLADEGVHGGVVREVRAGTAPLDEQPVALLVVEQGHLGQPQLRSGHQGGDGMLEVGQEPLGRGGLEQLGAVLELTGEARSALVDGEGQVELRGVDGRFHRAQREPWQVQVHAGHVLQHEHDAEELGSVGLQGPEVLEGNVLVGVSVQGDAAHAAQQLAQGGVAVEPGAQHQGVEEEADEALELGLVAAGDGRADDDVVLAGVAAEHELEGGQQSHEGRGALTAAQLRQRGGQLRAQLQRGMSSGTPGRLRAGEVGGQLEVGCAVQLLLPPLELSVECLTLEPLALPGREVGVLERGLRQGRWLSRGEGLEERAQLPHQHTHGPQVRDDVVHRQHQDVVSRPEPHQHALEERTLCQVEGLEALGEQLAPCLLFRRLVSGHVHDGEQEGRGWVDDLDGRPVRARAEVGAQRLVTPHQLREAALEKGDVQVSLQPDQEGHVVRAAPRLELVQEPQALLGEGERQRGVTGGTPQRRHRQAVADARRGLDVSGQRGDSGRLEEGSQGDIHAEGGADARHRLGCQQRVAAQGEEVVQGAHAWHAQHGGVQLGKLLLQRRAGLDVGEARGEQRLGGGGQGLAVHLAVGREGEGVQRDEEGGHQVLGQLVTGPVAQGARVEGAARLRHQPRHQPSVTVAVAVHARDGLEDLGVTGEGGFDFAQLDAEATHLHLEVGAAEEVQGAVMPPARQVSGAVHAAAGRGGERVRNEALSGEVRSAQVATHDALAGDEQLAGHADGHRLAAGVQHVQARVGDGSAEGDGGDRVGVLHAVGGGPDGGLRRAVHIGEGRVGQGGTERARQGAGQGFAAHEQVAQRGQGGDGLGRQHQGAREGGRALKVGDGVATQHLGQGECLLAAGGGMLVMQDDVQSSAQRPQQLQDVDVEGDGGDGQPRATGGGLQQSVHRGQEVGGGAVGHHDALGQAGAARGVDDVR